ncbi:MAG: lipoyl synthase [SAR202 cluster bacterium]|nr:lipoyl synthase [SAR202 cluster bacterium]
MTTRKLPDWFKVKAPSSKNFIELRNLFRENELHTVCEEAKCPNIGGCWDRKTATFMILGDVCTRACAYCAVKTGKPIGLDLTEPTRLAQSVKKMGLKYVVITSVNRDDLPDGGSFIFSQCVKKVRKEVKDCKIEVLIPDFQGNMDSLMTILGSKPDTLNHNIESVRRIFPRVRPQGDFDQSLKLLGDSKEIDSSIVTKSGMMVGLGETWDEILETMQELRAVKCDALTIGQYLRPSEKHVALSKWYTPEEFSELQDIGYKLGFSHVFAGPLVRSSYHAAEQHDAAIKGMV